MLLGSSSDHTTNEFFKKLSFFSTSLRAGLSPGSLGEFTPRNGSHGSLGQMCRCAAADRVRKSTAARSCLAKANVLLQAVLHGMGWVSHVPDMPQGYCGVSARAAALGELGCSAGPGSRGRGSCRVCVTEMLFPQFGQEGPGPGRSEGCCKYLFPDSVFLCTIICLLQRGF